MLEYRLSCPTMSLDTALGIDLMLTLEIISHSRRAVDDKELLLVLSNCILMVVVHLFFIAASNIDR